MKILILGSGPVATVLATSLRREHEVALASRYPEGALRGVRAERVRAVIRRRVSRDVRVLGLSGNSERWDLIIATASPHFPAIAAALSNPALSGAIAGVTQVPSEVAELERLAGARPWGLIAPGFLAWGSEATKWWRIGPQFTLAGPASLTWTRLFPRPMPVASVERVLLQAATMMPVVAALQLLDFDLFRASSRAPSLARAIDEARASIAASHAHPAPSRVAPAVVWAALLALPLIAPMNLRDYLRSHFGSHTQQTVRLLDDWIANGRRHGLDTLALAEIRDGLG